MKNCRDCKFNRKDIFGKQFDECRHPESSYTYCSVERRGNTDCGRNATRFEPKTPRFMWLRNLFVKSKQPKAEFNFEGNYPEMYSWSKE